MRSTRTALTRALMLVVAAAVAALTWADGAAAVTVCAAVFLAAGAVYAPAPQLTRGLAIAPRSIPEPLIGPGLLEGLLRDEWRLRDKMAPHTQLAAGFEGLEDYAREVPRCSGSACWRPTRGPETFTKATVSGIAKFCWRSP